MKEYFPLCIGSADCKMCTERLPKTLKSELLEAFCPDCFKWIGAKCLPRHIKEMNNSNSAMQAWPGELYREQLIRIYTDF